MIDRLGPVSPARRFWLSGLVLAWLAGCAQTDRRVSSRDASAFWSGRLLLQLQAEPVQTFTASFELMGSPEAGELHILSPLGQHLARLLWSQEQAQLQRGQEQTSRPTLDALVRELTGTDLPVAALFQWLAGRPDPAAGWQVDLGRHAQGRISAQRLLPAPPALLRIVLDR
jgi:outer membrane lipoprotein LolB